MSLTVSAENMRRGAGVAATARPFVPPALLTLAMILEHYVPVGQRTLFRWISAGTFPKADIGIGGKVRLWKRETVETWIEDRAEGG